MTPEEKREVRFKKWLEAPEVNFISPKAKKDYQTRVKRFQDTLTMKIPDRVPVSNGGGNFGMYYGGCDLHTAMYDYDALVKAWMKFFNDFKDYSDTFGGPGVYSAKVFEILGYKLYKWPGNGLAEDVDMFQFVEGEYMSAADYDDFLRDPSDYALRTFMPRTSVNLKAFENLVPFTSMMGMGYGAVNFAGPAGNPEVWKAFETLHEAGLEMAKWGKKMGDCGRQILEAGYPGIRSAFALAPFDSIADILRGTSGTSKDMYRNPDKLLAAMDKVADITIKNTLNTVDAFGAVCVGLPLHKGDDVFMSDKQFEKFYWPSLKKILMAFINEGLMVNPVAEGKYERRLEAITDMPRGWVHWTFDETDMGRAKKIVGKNQCISGIIPYSMMLTKSTEELRDYVRRRIEICADGGGFILSGHALTNEKDYDKIKLFMEVAEKYGTYK